MFVTNIPTSDWQVLLMHVTHLRVLLAVDQDRADSQAERLQQLDF